MGYFQEGNCRCCSNAPAIVGPVNEDGLCDTCVKWLAKRKEERAKDQALREREPLVQLVLEKYNALTACALNGQSSCENEDAALFEALRQLQDRSPE